VGVDRPDDDDPRLESVDTHEAHATDTIGATDGADVLDAAVLDADVLDGDVLDEADAPGERADRPGRLEAHVDLRARADDAYRAHAIDQGCDRVREIEEAVVTPAMRRIEAEDPNRSLVGLEFRLKGRERLSEKVSFDMTKKGITPDEAFAGVKDAIRYTFQYTEHDYTSGVYSDCDRLAAEGFELVERRNSWVKEEYKGINSRWRSAEGGQLFEVQFHTQASFEAKQETHWAYERLRSGIPAAEQKRLDLFQRDVTARVPIPPSAPDIPDYP
jgi:hypothetical protein